MANEKAPEGTIFVCGACGKSARYRYGFDENNKNDPEASDGWDSSCMTWAILVHEDSIERSPGGRVIKGTAVADVKSVNVTVKVTA